jgi:predicted TIM-barrel fold metal-dependent hydrolase
MRVTSDSGEEDPMKDGMFVIDAHTGFWDASRENCRNKYGEAFIETFYAFHTGFNPTNEPQWTMDYEETFRKVDPDWYLETMFVEGDNDMAILSTQVLMDFYHTGFTNPERNAELVKRAPNRLIALGGIDPRAPDALEQVDHQVQDLGMRGFKWYTAEWRGESRGWKANDPMVFPLYERCIELGVTNMHFHKGPAVEPLALEKFDVRDIDEPSTLYPELNFIVDHCGMPRLDDFCWLSARSPNVYANLSVSNMFLGNRPREFAKVMANLLFWLGPDRITWGTDFPIWYPHWLLDRFMAFELPADIEDEYGVTLTKEIKQKIVGENIARLYGIDIEAKKQELAGDDFDTRHNEFVNSVPARTRPGQVATDTGVAGTAAR